MTTVEPLSPGEDNATDIDPVADELLDLFHDHDIGHLPSAERRTELNAGAGQATGDIIGRYKLLQKIGEGGMAEVWVAEQREPGERRVALKILKGGMNRREVVARFAAERRILALMDHPHIAHVLDGRGTIRGRPYFVMELVRGEPITDFCNRAKLHTRQRLELFIEVCEAVQHAHLKGIIHRDIKPSNILVSDQDGKPHSRVIDFGVAKIITQPLTEKTPFMPCGEMIGTPAYMSPEQTRFSADEVDIRSDIHALGVLLYELLTGSTPFEDHQQREVAFDEVCRTIREVVPPKPSAKLSALRQESSPIAALHGSDVRTLDRAARGKLDWITMKALQKDRNRRYQTAAGFANDVGRYLRGEGIEARPHPIS